MASAEQIQPGESQSNRIRLPSGLSTLPGYFGFVPQIEVEKTLLSPGDYAVWGDDSSSPYAYKLAIRRSPTEVRHIPLVCKTQDASRMWATAAEAKFHTKIQGLITVAQSEGGCKVGNEFILMKRQVPRPKRFIRDTEIKIERFLDEGNFCAVNKAILKQSTTQKQVAVKSFKGHFDPSYEATREKKQLVVEVNVMSGLDHPNVIHFHGIVCDLPPIKIVMEYCPGGSLLKHLEAQKDGISVAERLLYCFQAARGMSHLEEKNIIHRDLAARNCLIAYNATIKIADFGLSTTDADAESESMDPKARFPIRLMSPETLQKHPRYSHKSDVWAFGMLMWEIFSNGAKPWPDDVPKEIRRDIKAGSMPPLQKPAPKEVQEIMKRCWVLDPAGRPAFLDLCRSFSQLIIPTGLYPLPRTMDRALVRIKGVHQDAEDDLTIQPVKHIRLRQHPTGSSVTDDTHDETQQGPFFESGLKALKTHRDPATATPLQSRRTPSAMRPLRVRQKNAVSEHNIRRSIHQRPRHPREQGSRDRTTRD